VFNWTFTHVFPFPFAVKVTIVFTLLFGGEELAKAFAGSKIARPRTHNIGIFMMILLLRFQSLYYTQGSS